MSENDRSLTFRKFQAVNFIIRDQDKTPLWQHSEDARIQHALPASFGLSLPRTTQIGAARSLLLPSFWWNCQFWAQRHACGLPAPEPSNRFPTRVVLDSSDTLDGSEYSSWAETIIVAISVPVSDSGEPINHAGDPYRL
jgi:hypothetical protein